MKQLTRDEFWTKWYEYEDKAIELASRRNTQPTWFFSISPIPCNCIIKRSFLKPAVLGLWHLIETPCDQICESDLPIAECLCQTGNDKFFHTQHKVGECPWKIDSNTFIGDIKRRDDATAKRL
jgi:hypothetical protein